MLKANVVLVVLLRAMGLVALSAVFAAFFPFHWMAAIHAWLGLGPLPDVPVVGYLTRSVSGLYAGQGALLLYLSFDVRRHIPVIRVLALLSLAFGVGMLPLDLAVGMPLPWTLCEGPFIIAWAVAVYWLTWRLR